MGRGRPAGGRRIACDGNRAVRWLTASAAGGVITFLVVCDHARLPVTASLAGWVLTIGGIGGALRRPGAGVGLLAAGRG